MSWLFRQFFTLDLRRPTRRRGLDQRARPSPRTKLQYKNCIKVYLLMFVNYYYEWRCGEIYLQDLRRARPELDPELDPELGSDLDLPPCETRPAQTLLRGLVLSQNTRTVIEIYNLNDCELLLQLTMWNYVQLWQQTLRVRIGCGFNSTELSVCNCIHLS